MDAFGNSHPSVCHLAPNFDDCCVFSGFLDGCFRANLFRFYTSNSKMKQIVTNQTVKIPEGITVTAKSRVVTVKGPRGVLKRSFKHLALDIRMLNPRVLKVEKWFGTKKELAAVRTVCSHVENMLKGVTKGYQYKMRAVYAHFPINCVTTEK
ncbi:Ribosomal protein L6 [Popillia japonica]|uniref:Large ribosomal subunit protein uL6 n=1 Tax=Popillia japonica TaxID=7064 RepID=A0AAW1L8Z0_POPJA